MITQEKFQEILKKHKRVAIVGAPGCGKTSLADTCSDRLVLHNDDGKHLDWQSQPEYWKSRAQGHESFLIEGIQASRAIRKGLQVDAIIELDQPYIEHSRGQASMAKGQKTIMADVIRANPKLKVYR